MGFEVPFWRSVGVFRLIALIYPAVLLVLDFRQFAHPAGAGLLVAAMTGWSAYAVYAYAAPARRTWRLLTADLAVTTAVVAAAGPIVVSETGERIVTMIPGPWIGGAVLAWAVSGGRRRGAVAALVVGAVDVAVRGRFSPATINGVVIMLLAGVVVGHVARLAADTDRAMQRAVELEAATRERERLARGIHDSVLQVLALVQRRGAELGGDAAELGRLAGEQEVALRTMVGATHAVSRVPGGPVDLRTSLDAFASPSVTVAAPATGVPLAERIVAEIAAAVAGALDNVERHCPPGTRAWVLVEDLEAEVTVTVRDDGPGMARGRLAEAEAAGRLGVAQSIRGRIRALGGTVTIESAPGEGTEIELRVPR